MVWCCGVWYGVVGCGGVWRGIEWCDVVGCGVVGWGVVFRPAIASRFRHAVPNYGPDGTL